MLNLQGCLIRSIRVFPAHMKKRLFLRAAPMATIAGTLAFTACDKPAPGLDTESVTVETTVFDEVSRIDTTAGRSSSNAEPVTTKPEVAKVGPVKDSASGKTPEPVKASPVPTPAPGSPPACVAINGPKITMKPVMP